MYSDALLLEMLTDRDVVFALRATGSPEGARLHAAVRAVRGDPVILAALLDDDRVFLAVSREANILLKVGPYFHFSVLLRQARRELGRRTFTAEWLGPRRRVPVFDAHQVADVLEDEGRLHYLADLLASFASADRMSSEVKGVRLARRLDLEDLRRRRDHARPADRFALDRRLGDAALFRAGVFPDSARGTSELENWEIESRFGYHQAALAPLAQECGLREVLDGLAGDLHPTRKALNFVADRFLYPLRADWFPASA